MLKIFFPNAAREFIDAESAQHIVIEEKIHITETEYEEEISIPVEEITIKKGVVENGKSLASPKIIK